MQYYYFIVPNVLTSSHLLHTIFIHKNNVVQWQIIKVEINTKIGTCLTSFSIFYVQRGRLDFLFFRSIRIELTDAALNFYNNHNFIKKKDVDIGICIK